MAINFYAANALTGGVLGALDWIDGASLNDGDAALVITGGYAFFFTLDADSAAAESSPSVISPDDNPGDKRWVLVPITLSKLSASGLKVMDSGGDHWLTIACGTNLTADRVFNIVTGDSARTITLSGDPTLADWFDQAVKTTSSPTFDHAHLTNGLILPDASAPVTAANECAVYAKNVGGTSEVYVRKESEGAEVRITEGTALSVGLPAGLGPLPWPTDTPPAGWLLCYGQAVSRADYSALYAVIGDTFGNGNGSTTFNVPDCRGRTLLGKDNMGGSSADRVTAATADTIGSGGGAETHLHTAQTHVHTTANLTLTAAQSGLRAHSHKYDIGQSSGGLGPRGLQSTTVFLEGTTKDVNAAPAIDPHNHGYTGAALTEIDSTSNTMPYLTSNWIIKT